jgi:hypothetical protein
MHVPINVKYPNNISEWQMGFNSAFKGLMYSAAQRVLGGENKVTLFKLTKYDFAAAFLETSVLLLLTGMHT